MSHEIYVIVFILHLARLNGFLAEDVQSVPLQYISFSAVPDLPFAERLLTYRAGSNTAGGQETSKLESLNTTGDSCPAESECSFMSNCPTLRRIQPAQRCDVILNPTRPGQAGMRLPGGTCCRQHSRPSPSLLGSFRPLPVLSVAISTAAFGASNQDLPEADLPSRNKKSGHLVNFVVSPNAAGTEQYGSGGKSPLVLLPPNKDVKMSFLPGEAPVNIKQSPAMTTQTTVPTAGQSGPSTAAFSSVNGGEKAPLLPAGLPLTRPTGGMESGPTVTATLISTGLLTQPVQSQQAPHPAPPQQLQYPQQPSPQPIAPPQFQQLPNFGNIPPQQYQQGAFQGPPQSPQQPYYAPPNLGPAPGAPQQQQQQPLFQQALPLQQPQFLQPNQPVFSQQGPNYPPQMPIPAPIVASYGTTGNGNQYPNPSQNFMPPQQMPQSQQQQQQFIPPNPIQMMPNASVIRQPVQQAPVVPPSRMSVVPQQQQPMPAPTFSAFNAFGAPPATSPTTFCGVRDLSLSGRAGRILGGRPSEFGAWPWMAVITSSKRLRCGATILNEQFLITAAHCVYKNYQYGYYQDLSVRIGIFSMDEDESGPYPPQEVRILQVYVHPFFNLTQSSYDIALIQVASPIFFRPHIKPVCLPSSEHLGEVGTVLGWGKRKESDDRSNLPMVLQEVNMPILYPWQCILELRGNKIYEDVGPQFVCAGGKANQDACRGDSGGPLLALSNGQYWEMIGIVSKGYGCGKENVPGIYTNIFFLKDWIESTVSANWNIFSGQFGSRERTDYYR